MMVHQQSVSRCWSVSPPEHSLLGPLWLCLHRAGRATCCSPGLLPGGRIWYYYSGYRIIIPGGGRGKLVRSEDAVTRVHLDNMSYVKIICDEFVTRMSSRPVLSSQPRKVELLETLINNYVTIEMENRKIGIGEMRKHGSIYYEKYKRPYL